MSLQKLVDVLKDDREEVRNEMLLLLRSLTRRNDEICKFIAFQDGFDILISILVKEKGSICRDCLNIKAILESDELADFVVATS